MLTTFSARAATTAALIVAALPATTVDAAAIDASGADETIPCVGRIAVTLDASGRMLGWFAKDLAFGRLTDVQSGSDRAGRYTVTYASGDDPDLHEIAPIGGFAADRAWLGGALAFTNTRQGDLGPGNPDYVYLTHGSRTTPGAAAAPAANAFGSQQPYESAVWTIDDEGVVDVRWINTDGEPFDAVTFVQSFAFAGAAGDLDAVREKSPLTDNQAATFTLVPDAGSEAACGFPVPQVVTFDEGTPATGLVGRTATITATGGASGNPVTLASTTPEVCAVDDDGGVTYLAAGTCTVTADQAGAEPNGDDGDTGYADAVTATANIAVDEEPSTVVLTSTEDPVVGRDVELTADVSSDAAAADPTPAGTVQFSVDDVEVGDPVAVDADGEATYDAGPLAKGAHDLDAVFTPADADVVAGSSDDAVVTVAAADTTTTLTVERRQVSATVTVDEPGAGTPTGDVVFSVDNTEIGTAALVNGIATLNEAVPAGDARNVAAVYEGDDDYNGSSDSTTRTDPVVTTAVTSPEPPTNGWFTAPVTVTFTCGTPDAELTKPCPSPVTRSKRVADTTVTRTVRSVDGGATTVTATFSIDKRGPFLTFEGVEPRTVYPNGVPERARCTAVDDLSGVDDDGCTLRKKRVEGTNRVVLTATATDVAGNPSTKSIVVFVPRSAGAAGVSGPR